MKKLSITFTIIFVLFLQVYNFAQENSFFIGHTADSISVFDSTGNLAAKLFWDADTVSGDTATLIAQVLTQPYVPASDVGQNYPLSHSIRLKPVFVNTVHFLYSRIKMRLYTDTSLFRIGDLEMGNGQYDIYTYKFISPSIYESKFIFEINTKKNYIDFLFDWSDTISVSSVYSVSALHIIDGTIKPGDLPDTVNVNLFVPGNKNIIIKPGFEIYTSNYSEIIVRGKAECLGTIENPIKLGMTLAANGPYKTNAINLPFKIRCSYVQGAGLSGYSANVKAEESEFSSVYFADSSKLDLQNVKIKTLVEIGTSYLTADSCDFLKDIYFNIKGSVCTISNSIFENLTQSSSVGNSYFQLRNNTIYTDAFLSPFEPLNTLFILDGNKIIYSGAAGDNFNCVGIDIWEGSYAIVWNNIIKGFRNAVEIGYNNHSVIYNNTFVDNNGGVDLYATVDSVSIQNNIIAGMEYAPAIELEVSTNNWKDNRAWIDHNLWYGPKGWGYLHPDTTGSGVVVKGGISINADPEFADTSNYKLLSSSPAIGAGINIIKAFPYKFSVLDTTVLIGDTLKIAGYSGTSPNLGSLVFNTVTDIKTLSAKEKPAEFKLFQNYPNPFNPTTVIHYELPNEGFVSLKIYDALGRDVATLVNGQKQQGRYDVNFDASKLASGIYFYQLRVNNPLNKDNNFVSIKKMLLLK